MRNLKKRQRGVSTLYWAVALVPLAAAAALGVGVQNVFVASAELQNAADAGALEGAVHLYDESGTALQAGVATERATAAATANFSRGSAVEVTSVEIGHWRFDPDGGGQFTPVGELPDELVSLVGKTFYNPDDPENSLNDPESGHINAVRVTTGRDQTPVEVFFSGFFRGPQEVFAQAVAWLGNDDSGIEMGEVDQPIAICQDAILDSQTHYTCSIGRLIPTTTETGGWTDFSVENACQGGTNAAILTDLINYPTCNSYNPDPIPAFSQIATQGGQVQSAFSDLFGCWEAFTERTQPWGWTLPVIECSDGNPGPCNTVLGTVEVAVLYMIDQANNIAVDAPVVLNVPDNMALNNGSWSAPEAESDACPYPDGSEEYGICRWDSFVAHYNLVAFDTTGDGVADPAVWNDNPQLNGWRQKSIYFAPTCNFKGPQGGSGVRNFGIMAAVPVLVD